MEAGVPASQRCLFLDVDALLGYVNLVTLIDFKDLLSCYFFSDPVGLLCVGKCHDLFTDICSALNV